MNSETFDALTTFLAIWGAALSSIAVGWNILRDLRDKGKLRVEAMIGRIFGQGNRLLSITITNVGRQPIFVTKLFAKHKTFTTGFTLFRTPQLPKMLSSGEYIIILEEDLNVISEDLTGIWAVDSLEKKWKISRKNCKKLLKDKQEREQENASNKSVTE